MLQVFVVVWQLKPCLKPLRISDITSSLRFSFPEIQLRRPAGKLTRHSIGGYEAVLQQVEKQQAKMVSRYRHSWKERERQRLVKEAREFLLETISRQIFPAWYGTAWAFSGQTDRPGQGAIACGIFVATVLNHAGFALDRVRLGIQPSRYIITNLTGQENLWRLSGRSLKQIQREITRRGRNLYIVGLDKHTGFIFYDGRHQPVFIHASGQKGLRQVVAEELTVSETLRRSRYFILGQMLTEKMMEDWLTRRFIPISSDYYCQARALSRERAWRTGRRHG